MNSIKEIIKKDYPNLEGNEPISKAIAFLKDTDAIVILDGGKYQGMLSKRDISIAKISPETKAKSILKNVAKLSIDESIEATAGLMLESDSYVLPVFEKGKIVGIITAEDLLKKAVENKFGEETIDKYISKPVIKIASDDSVGKAIKIFKEEYISRLPVYENNRPSGIITLDDTISKFIQTEHRPGGSGQYEDKSKYGAIMSDKKEYYDIPVKGVMSSSLLIVPPDERISDVVNEMFKREYRGMLIGKDNEIEGIVTKRDLLEPLATSTILEPIVIQFSGELDKIKDFNKQRPKEIIFSNFKKHLDYLDNAYIYVRLKQHYEQSKGKHYIFCKMRLSSPRGMFVAAEEGWGFMDAINKSLEAIEKQIRRFKRR
jgi:CBS domain-containing protein/ribosome-associated translation inhibitor RaiA